VNIHKNSVFSYIYWIIIIVIVKKLVLVLLQ